MSFHQTIVQGNLGKDPDLKTLGSGSEVANFSVAVTEKWKTNDGEAQEHTEWYNVKIFGKQAETAEKYLHKGDAVLLVGRLRTRTYDKDGETKYVTELIVDRLQLLDNRGRDGGGSSRDRDERPARSSRDSGEKQASGRSSRGNTDRGGDRQEPSRARSAQRDEPSKRDTGRREPERVNDDQDFDDDIPF
jgi:single-strand DNA-binding protein